MTAGMNSEPARNAPDNPRAMALARKAIMGAGIIGTVTCLYGVFLAGPAGNLSNYELLMVPLMGLFSALMIIVFGLNRQELTRRAGIVFSIWLGIYATSCLTWELYSEPDFGNAVIYIIWMPATYLYAIAVANLKISMRISMATTVTTVISFLGFIVLRSPPSPGSSHVWDALVVGIAAQPAMLAIIYGVARYHEFNVYEHAKLEQLTEHNAALAGAAELARQGLLEAEKAAAAKSQFLTNVTHELRTPLNGILGLTELLQERTLSRQSNAADLKYLDAIRDSGKNLLTLIEQVVTLSAVESPAFDLKEDAISLEHWLNHCAARFEHLPEAQGHCLEVNMEFAGPDGTALDGDVELEADHAILSQMCLALLSNAGKFTRPPSKITLSASYDKGAAGHVVISVRDQGEGIPPDLHRQLGQPFFQVDSTTSRMQSGLGLGLALVRSGMAAHGGTLIIEARPEGGTEARMIMPAHRVVGACPAQVAV